MYILSTASGAHRDAKQVISPAPKSKHKTRPEMLTKQEDLELILFHIMIVPSICLLSPSGLFLKSHEQDHLTFVLIIGLSLRITFFVPSLNVTSLFPKFRKDRSSKFKTREIAAKTDKGVNRKDIQS
jgi:hypothetical protein